MRPDTPIFFRPDGIGEAVDTMTDDAAIQGAGESSQLVSDQTAVVTGGASGVGRAIALTFASHGADIVVADVTREPREGGEPTHEVVETETDREARFVQCDVTERADLEDAVSAAEAFGGIDVMVNNAGLNSETDALAVTEEEYDRVMDVNVKGVFFGCQVAAEALIERDDGGSIINMASLAADLGTRTQPLYCTSKGAVKTMTYAMADRFADHDIRVNAIKPSYTKTQMLESSGMGEGEAGKQFEAMMKQLTPAGRFGEAEEVARVALFLASDLSSYITAESIAVDGGLGNT